MVLIDEEKGVLTAMDEFKYNNKIDVMEGSEEVAAADVFRIHDYNYLMKIIELSENKLKDSENAVTIRYGNINLFSNIIIDRDTALSSESWKASLVSCGSVIKAVDTVM